MSKSSIKLTIPPFQYDQANTAATSARPATTPKSPTFRCKGPPSKLIRNDLRKSHCDLPSKVFKAITNKPVVNVGSCDRRRQLLQRWPESTSLHAGTETGWSSCRSSAPGHPLRQRPRSSRSVCWSPNGTAQTKCIGPRLGNHRVERDGTRGTARRCDRLDNPAIDVFERVAEQFPKYTGGMKGEGKSPGGRA